MSKLTNDPAGFPSWGPYSKKYMGISHIVSSAKRPGVRFDLTTVPAIANLDIHLPNVTLPTGWHPWDAASDGRQFAYRVDLEWKDRLYADVSYTRLSEHETLIRTELVNRTELPQNLMINYFSSIEYPQTSYCDPVLPEGAVFIDALDYETFTYARPRPWDRQNSDGRKIGEAVDPAYTDGHGLGDRAGRWHLPSLPFGTFGADAGDWVSYRFFLERPMESAVLSLRYRSTKVCYEYGLPMEVSVHPVPADQTARFLLNDRLSLVFPPSDEPVFLEVPLGALEAGSHTLSLVSKGTGGLELDFLAVAPEGSPVDVSIQAPPVHPRIQEEKLADGALVSLIYPDIEETYYLRTLNPNTRFRRIESGSLEDGMSSRLSNPDPTFDDVLAPFTASFRRKHSDDGFFHNTLVYTLFLEPETSRVEYAVLSDQPIEPQSAEYLEAIYRASVPEPMGLTKAGEGYAFSTRLLKAAVLTNIVFPIQKDLTYVLHPTPGKRWDSLYTWDSGFIGLGLLDYAPALSDYLLELYTCEPGKPEYAFLHHGSPVPVQIYLFYEMLQRASDQHALLEKYYPRLRYYYEFLVGRGSGSTTARYKSGMTSTYDYFYSSSGMDDYPAQAHMIADGLQRSAAPVISSCQVIRFAKILKKAASLIGLAEDIRQLDRDIDRISKALQQYSWDPDAGYFSYVLHDEQARPTGIYRTEDGENLNKGLDGIYPLIAGICTEEQEHSILRHLEDPHEMLSPYGISAVDQSASYFQLDGYWNGNVWFPHQWFIWKTLLDLGETEFAHTVAMLALNVWKKEVDATHYTFEMVNVTTGRGGWFHNFGGLSTPIGLWANAYFRPGTVNVGFDTLIEQYAWEDQNQGLSLRFRTDPKQKPSSLLAVLEDDCTYRVLLDQEPVSFKERYPGMLEIPLPADGRSHDLQIEPKE